MIWAKVRWPSQRSSTCRPVPCSLIAPSGNRIMRSSLPALFSAPQRQPIARRGWLESSGGAMLAALDSKRARRRPSRLHVGEVERVELRPENVALVAQGLDRQLLLGSRLGIVEDIVHRELRILRRLIKPGLEIIETSRKPRIELPQLLDA